VVALVGANGSGKSTLLRAVAGSIPLLAGGVEYEGAPVPAGRRLGLRTAFAGLCPQDPSVVLAAESCSAEVGRTLASRRLRTDPAAVLATWGLAGLEDRDPRDLSAGQRQRLATAAMLAHDPRVWLLDEPTRGADADTRRWLEGRLAAHATAGGAAIVATHDIEAAARFATRVVGLEAGEIAFDLPVAAALGSGGRYPTQTARVVPGALVPEDVTW
jgi:energy-coupling factor transport system ATP-binding protein